MTAIASGCWSCDPAPSASASGARANAVAQIVIATGRNRRFAASRHASSTAEPERSAVRASWITNTAFSPTMPTIMIAPTKLETFNVMPVTMSAPKTPASTASAINPVKTGARQSPNSKSRTTPTKSRPPTRTSRSPLNELCCCS